MFVPLPVPFVFQRTAPDLNAWRLKSPLALRSNSGKTCFYFCVYLPPPSFSSAPPAPPPCRPASQIRLSGAIRCAHTHLRALRGLMVLRFLKNYLLFLDGGGEVVKTRAAYPCSFQTEVRIKALGGENVLLSSR